MEPSHDRSPSAGTTLQADSPRCGAGGIVPVGAIIILAVVWRLLGITTTEAWRDEAVTLLHLQAGWWDLMFRLPFVEDSPPLYFLVMKAWSLFFHQEWTMRLQAVVFGTAAVVTLMMVARGLAPRSWWLVGLLAAVAPVLVHYSQELRVYGFMMLLVALCFWAIEMIVRDPRSRRGHLLWGVFAALAAHCHAVGLFVYPMTAVYLLVRLSRQRRWSILSLWSTGVWLVGCTPMFWFNLHWAAKHKTTGWWIDPVSGTRAYDLLCSFTGATVVSQSAIEAIHNSLADVLEIGSTYFIFACCVACAAAALRLPRTRNIALALLASLAVYTLLMLATSLTGVPNMIDRTMLPIAVPLLLLLGIGADSTLDLDGPKRWLLPASAVLMAGLWAAGWFWMAEYSENERRAAQTECFRYLREELGADDMLVITPSWLEDSAAYHLRDIVSGEQLFTTDAPTYAGRPPRHMLMHSRITITGKRIKEGPWSERIRAARRERQGKDYSVWLISGFWQDFFQDPVVEQLESFFEGDFRRVDKYSATKLTGIVAQRYVSIRATQPATGPAVPAGK
ncbi:MAG TPA: glycosyltransferase family 39 protein [Phycisphaerae bacterium]|nr:glycosyltransferase family 39 protein [Phycisphaerae bacterium]